jgi:hypothetical protein
MGMQLQNVLACSVWVLAGTTIILGASGCASARIRESAAYVLACPKSQVEVVELYSDTYNTYYGAAGCGRKVKCADNSSSYPQCDLER